ncbi:MAG: PEP-CTERM sorting domain-containing protein [Mariniblastus sp.]|nr:PEP-CTERM sorting domain-containing protein [Mariniblastus sp.]
MSNKIQPEKLDLSTKRWAAYVAAGAAATLAGTQTAEADITHVVVGGSEGAFSFGIGQKSFDLDGNAKLLFAHLPIGSATDRGVAAGGLNTLGSALYGNVAGQVINGYAYAANLSLDANVSTAAFLELNAGGTMAYGNGYGNSQFLNNTGNPSTGFLAFRFSTFAGGSNFQYGWARVTLNGDTPLNTFVLEEYAYADQGESIRVGEIDAIPEPGSLGCLALGALGLLASRRRRKAS